MLDKVKDYVECNEITKNQVEEYIGLFPIWTKNFMDEVLEEG